MVLRIRTYLNLFGPHLSIKPKSYFIKLEEKHIDPPKNEVKNHIPKLLLGKNKQKKENTTTPSIINIPQESNYGQDFFFLLVLTKIASFFPI